MESQAEKAKVMPEKPERKKEMSQEELAILYLQKQLAAMDSYQAMISAGRDGGKELEDYKKYKENWRKNKEDVVNVEKQLSQDTIEAFISVDVNLNRASVELALEKLGGTYPPTETETPELAAKEPEIKIEKIEPQPVGKTAAETVPTESADKERIKSAPVPKDAWMGIGDVWQGGRVPENINEARIKQYIDFVRRASGENSLKYQYALSLLENVKERPARQAAESHRDEVRKLEEENEKLKKELAGLKTAERGVFEEPADKEVSRRGRKLEENEAELEEKKKGWSLGDKFKKGVKGFFDKFKKEEKKEEKPEESKEAKIKELKNELEILEKEKWEKIKQSGVVEQGQIEEEYKNKKAEVEKQIKGLEQGKEVTGSSVSGWFKERSKGFFGGFGWWEAHQAEKFRLGTKETGKEAKAQVKLLEQEAGLLDEEEGREEAYEVEAKRESEEEYLKKVIGSEADPKRVREIAVEYLSNRISAGKKEYNEKVEDKIVVLALQKLEEKIGGKEWFQAYKAANGGRALTSERAQDLEKRMREEIGKLRKGQTKKDLVDFVKLSRQSLDKNWWHRYIYAGLDAVLAGLLIKWVVGKYFGGKAVEAVGGKVTETAAGKAGATATEKAVEIAAETGLKDTIWAEAQRMLIKEGVTNPTNAQTLKVATKIAVDSGVKVMSKATGEVIWQVTSAGAKGVDIALQKGFLLKLGGAVKEIATIKAGLGAVGI